MAVIDVSLHWNGSPGSREIGDKHQYAAVYRARTNDPLDNAQVIIDYFEANIVELGDQYEYGNDVDDKSFARSIAPRRERGSNVRWEVVVTYDSLEPDDEGPPQLQPSGGGGMSANPVDWRDVPSLSHRAVSEPVFRAKYMQDIHMTAKDSYGPVINAAGQILDPPPEGEVFNQILSIEHYDSYFPNVTGEFVGRVNNANIDVNYPYAQYYNHFFTHQIKMLSWDGTWQRINGFYVWRWTVQFEIRTPSWVRQFPNIGTCARALDGDQDENGVSYSTGGTSPNLAPESGLRQLKDATGMPLQAPIPLDADGKPLAAGQPVQYLSYLCEREANFSQLRELFGLLGPEVEDP